MRGRYDMTTDQMKPVEPEDYLVQRSLLVKYVSDPQFAKSLDHVTSNLFPSHIQLFEIFDSSRTLYRKNKYSRPIGKDALRIKVAEKLDSRENLTVEERGQYDYMMEDLYTLEGEGDLTISEDMNEIIMNHIKTIRTTDSMKRAISSKLTPESVAKHMNELKEIEESTSYGAMPDIINVLSSDSIEHQVERMRELTESRVPVPIDAYNIGTGDGLAKGEMACVAGSSGNGKSMHLISLAVAYSIVQGKDVVYYVLEELQGRIYHRVYKNVIDHLLQRKDIFNKEQIQQLVALSNVPDILDSGTYEGIMKKIIDVTGIEFGALYILKYKPYELTVRGLRASMKTMTLIKELNIDVMMIDYPDLMNYDRSDGESEAGGRLYAEIRGVGQEFNVITWVASQLNRGTYGADIKTEAHIEGSYRKQNALEALFVINQTSDEYENGFTRVYVGKARNSKNKGQLLPMTVNKATSTLRNQTPIENRRHMMLLEDTVGGGGKQEEKTKEEVDAFAQNLTGANSLPRKG